MFTLAALRSKLSDSRSLANQLRLAVERNTEELRASEAAREQLRRQVVLFMAAPLPGTAPFHQPAAHGLGDTVLGAGRGGPLKQRSASSEVTEELHELRA